MVLDIYDEERDVLVFKNTIDDPTNGLPKKYEIERTDPDAPRELYFVHIDVHDMANLPSHHKRCDELRHAEYILRNSKKQTLWL